MVGARPERVRRPPEFKIKPEVCAPGVNIYSCDRGGGYSAGWSGTSFSAPHAAGIVCLLRQADPDLEVDAAKEILMRSARDEGPAGEDNSYGWGFVDALAAVSRNSAGPRPPAAGRERDGRMRIWPNPLDVGEASLTIRFRLDGPGPARLEISDAAGRRIRTLASGYFSRGEQRVLWDGRDDSGRHANSGVYFCRLRTGRTTQSTQVTIVR